MIIKQNLLFCLLLFCAFPIGCWSQEFPVNGSVISAKSNDPIPYANILAIDVKNDSLISAFAQTNELGEFELILKNRGLILEINQLGFKKRFISADSVQSGIIVKLYDKALELQEVVIKNTPPIRIKKDTTAYAIESFAEGNERNLEDVLKKLPGITVSDKGTISFNGKGIKKIMVEGDDFFSENYQLLSKNITPELIKSVEAIEHHNDEKLLRGIEKSDDVVLNLNFKKNFRASLFGNIEAGAGVKERYTTNATLFSFINGLKIGSITNLNNIGNDVINDTDFQSNIGLLDNQSTSTNSSRDISLPITNGEIYIPNIDKRRYLQNEAKLQALQLNTSVSDKLKLNMYGYYFADRNSMPFLSERTFLNEEQQLTITEDGKVLKRKREKMARIKLDYDLDSLSAISFTGILFRDSPSGSLNQTIRTNTMASDSVLSKDNQTSDLSYLNLSHIQRFSSSYALQTNLNYTSNNNAQHLLLSSPRYERMENFNSDELFQRFDLSQKNTSLAIKLLGAKKVHRFEVSGTYRILNSNLNSSLNDYDSENFNNDISYRQNLLALHLQDNFSLAEKFDIKLSVPVIYESLLLNSDNSKNTFFVNPSVSTSFKIKKANHIRVGAALTHTNPSPTDLYQNPIFSDYRSVVNKTNLLNTIKSFQYNLRYSYFTSSNYLRAVLYVSYRNQKSPYIVDLNVDELLNYINYLPSPLSNNFSNSNAEVNKFFYPLRSRIGIKGSLSTTQINRFQDNNVIAVNPVVNHGAGLFIYTAFSGIVNLKCEANFRTTTLKDKLTNTAFETTVYNNKFNLLLDPLETLSSEIIYEQVFWPNLNSHFIDFKINYEPEESNFSFQLTGRNLLDTKQLSFDTFSSTQIDRNIYGIVPRMVYLGVSYNLGKSPKG